MGVVCRDRRGKVILLATRLCDCISAQVAKIEASFWASKLMVELNWENLDWECDAKEVVNEIAGNEDLCCWYTRYTILAIRSSFLRKSGELKWHSRCSNQLADVAVKSTLANGCNLFLMIPIWNLIGFSFRHRSF